jgi:HD-like signal output (HDOD) protein/CheY-like chemotaxis protein
MMATVLVVDDMAVFREPIGAALRQRGFETREASNGDEALRLMAGERPDLVLLDVAMPRMDGISVLRAMREDKRLRTTPVILLTALADRERVVEAARLGVRDYMLKSSFSLQELHERIDRALGGQPQPAESRAEGGAESAPAAPADAPPAPAAASDAGADGLKSLRSLVTRSEMQERLDAAAELKAMSPAVAQVLELARNPRCSIEQLTRAVKRDHAISLKILKLANSTVYTRGEPVDSVQKAIMRIGMQQIAQTVMNIAVVEMFDEVSEPRISGSLFWEHSIATGLIAAEICRARGGKDDEVDASFTMGLIHDVGRLVYVETLGDTYGRVLDEAERLRLPLEQVESRLLIINHADAMDRVLHAWRFPKDLVNPVAFHHLSAGNIRRMAPTTVEEVATLALANRIAHALLVGSSGNGVVYPTEELADALRTPAGLFDRLLDEIPDQAADIKFAMLSRAKGASAWTPALDAALGALPRPVRAVHASGAPEFDAWRLLFRCLDCDAGDAPPNLGVLHLRDARERGRVSTAYLDAERDAEAGELPLLVVSPTGALRPDHAALAKRPMRTLPSTVRLDVLMEAVGGLVGAQA